MAWENGLALDMMLTKKGLYVMKAHHYCTFIPNYMVPDGTIAKAFQGLTTLPITQLILFYLIRNTFI